MKLIRYNCLLVMTFFVAFSILGQDISEVEKTHNDLRTLKTNMESALNKGDLDGLLKFVHKDVVFTAMNAEVAKGPEGIKQYFQKMMSGPKRIVESVQVKVDVDELTTLYGGDTGVAYGSSIDSYKLTDGLEFKVKSRWTSTLVKENGNWLVASFHSSADVFNNPVLDKSKSLAYWIGALAAGFCFVLGIFIGWVMRGKKN
ncbi:MAG: nuclear transport factor 2 family protein [Leptospiraceae bacterium]|nr:nuclear transport factor 2 family protein [Leptospiraceae bacterium]MCP5496888.1 nuclear transport factor 2 family protein [Leptospiraceae bacterium]